MAWRSGFRSFFGIAQLKRGPITYPVDYRQACGLATLAPLEKIPTYYNRVAFERQDTMAQTLTRPVAPTF